MVAWRFHSGRLCLDLMDERPADAAGLARWLVAAGLVAGAAPLDAVDGTWVARFGELGGVIERLVRDELDGRGSYAAADVARLNALAAAPPPAPRAVPGEGGRLVRALSPAPGCDALLAAVARDAVELLTDPVARARLRQCEGERCRRVYLDTSRGRRRRWCSSEVCGNRERVARHRARTDRALRGSS
ncbi:CGNR zinc finger domain-containing protein [Streptomyces ficellus]|uniref:CGNR zinc finger domain-containing protein n=1 Tax=Streptomyces ficellus TaxID=1977088 RepID=A0ABT7Z2F2_9ACTN|nr:CGNR zinc finger domain-containing protein [Streptomyces ficellus]MDN3293657.1 CGNR zinc finger domain-containing protein [Streptomyces ficellus]